MIKGLWPLRGSNPVLYTDKAADVILDTKTCKEYIRGERVLFHGSNTVIPKTIEETDPDRWQFYYPKDLKKGSLTTGDRLREIMVNTRRG